ncbi:hypothetical protein EUX98_g2970 [Antrodiella citrinella]|uniref:MYND-type domain-containing protein n=1 Tax=Antrodiella citrinella TaxID=2447956 RepID=A0A4S4MXP4_9APHY|nr:hypothetical protein EUX98_g2970 [Antrodiella citrinella]
MRESNFAFPAQNRACVCITSQLYDRRALDTNSPLPLFNSLTHLSYLTSTSPRIREIMTMDGGLERLVRILHDFCICPPPPENPALFYGLQPPTLSPAKVVPTLNPKSFDKHAAYRFSLAFQCVVNIGVRGSEPIRSRVVQAGTLDVVGCILEAWLAGKGFAVGPGASVSGQPRETREQRLARRQALNEARQRDQAAQLARALQRQIAADRIRAERITTVPQEDESMEIEQSVTESQQPPSRDTDDTSAETSLNTTPVVSGTPTGTVMVPSRDRSGTIIARPVWDQASTAGPSTLTGHHRRPHRSNTARLAVPPPSSGGASTANSTDTSRPDTETEDDGDVEMDQDDSVRESDAPSVSGASTPERRNPSPDPAATIRGVGRRQSRRAVGIVSDTGTPDAGGSRDMNTDAHIIINDQAVAVDVDGVGGIEDGIVPLEANDDFAMGAPPGAPGAIDGPPAMNVGDGHGPTGERTPRAGTINLPGGMTPGPNAGTARVPGHAEGTLGVPPTRVTARNMNTTPQAGGTGPTGMPVPPRHHHHHHHHDSESGPYRDEDVLLALQLLAYLSKYPHVRQAFYKPRVTFHPASAQQSPSEVRYAPGARPAAASSSTSVLAASGSSPTQATVTPKEPNAFLKALATATGRGKEKATSPASDLSASSSASTVTGAPAATAPRMTNVFSLVERFTFRPSSSEIDSPNPPPTLPHEIQHWAGVIMRNACRKDDSRGGIRQCANMMCGRWESYPREFAKCRRCRKAKYCGKECQSTAWSEGHRFWCSAKDPEEDDHHHATDGTRARANTATSSAAIGSTAAIAGSANRAERRAEREREREQRERQTRTRTEARILEQFGLARNANGSPAANNAGTGAGHSPGAVIPPQGVIGRPNPATLAATTAAATVNTAEPPAASSLSGWPPSILTGMRRPGRPRPDGAPSNATAVTTDEPSRAIIDRAVQFVATRRRGTNDTITPAMVAAAALNPSSTAATSMDVDLPADVRRHIMGILHTGRRTEERAGSSAEASPSSEMAQDSDEDDVDMVLE